MSGRVEPDSRRAAGSGLARPRMRTFTQRALPAPPLDVPEDLVPFSPRGGIQTPALLSQVPACAEQCPGPPESHPVHGPGTQPAAVDERRENRMREVYVHSFSHRTVPQPSLGPGD